MRSFFAAGLLDSDDGDDEYVAQTICDDGVIFYNAVQTAEHAYLLAYKHLMIAMHNVPVVNVSVINEYKRQMSVVYHNLTVSLVQYQELETDDVETVLNGIDALIVDGENDLAT